MSVWKKPLWMDGVSLRRGGHVLLVVHFIMLGSEGEDGTGLDSPQLAMSRNTLLQ